MHQENVQDPEEPLEETVNQEAETIEETEELTKPAEGTVAPNNTRCQVRGWLQLNIPFPFT